MIRNMAIISTDGDTTEIAKLKVNWGVPNNVPKTSRDERNNIFLVILYGRPSIWVELRIYYMTTINLISA